MPQPVQIRDALTTRASAEERVRGLLELGFTAPELAAALGVSASAVRNWSTGQASPRPAALVTIDDLRAVAAALLDGGFTHDEAATWMKSRNAEYLDDTRPIDRVIEDPMRVVAVAHLEGIGAKAAPAAASPPGRSSRGRKRRPVARRS